MLNRELARQRMPAIVAPHLPARTTSFRFVFHDEQIPSGAAGLPIDPVPFEGRIIFFDDDLVVVKTARTAFAVLSRRLVDECLELGATVRVEPYARRDFAGNRLDRPSQELRSGVDGTVVRTTTLLLGAHEVALPVSAAHSPVLKDMLHQLEALFAPDRYRSIAGMLVDAGARDFEVVDPPADADLLKTPPQISFTVETRRFCGRVSVTYQVVGDHYRVVATGADGTPVREIEPVTFDEIGQVFAELFDAHRRRIVLTAVAPAKRERTAA